MTTLSAGFDPTVLNQYTSLPGQVYDADAMCKHIVGPASSFCMVRLFRSFYFKIGKFDDFWYLHYMVSIHVHVMMTKNKWRTKNKIRTIKKLMFKTIIYESLFLCDNVLHSFLIKTITRPSVPLCGVTKQTGAGSASRPRGRTVFTVGTERYRKVQL